ncbi:hypothetical protein GCM10011352_27000 [Marinobacterium zhoushanense]|uniref:Uncharacterized protein n=1 Tax=Marinobacterium zhoushanense TaxID=1679163 RepID=A0ABQ1KGF6_9GAMM|nr:hypothetical protein [Marinobacterium zhoushanense]GGB99408.1 hypothetical protein GCM10011352_27000 [Marinobacterium zhoushanense]
MYLVKDLIDCRIVFYWLDETGCEVSPELCTFQDAEEWWKALMFERYRGYERRKSIIDRRTDFEKRQRMDNSHRFASINPYGRRVTDQPIKVDIDLAAEKLLELTAEKRLLYYMTTYASTLRVNRRS